MPLVFTHILNQILFFAANEILILEDCQTLLRPFKTLTVDLSGEQYPTAALVIPLVCALEVKLDEATNVRTEEGHLLRAALKDGVRDRLHQYERNKVTRASTFLDPKIKKCGFRVEEHFDDARRQVEGELRTLISSNHRQAEDEPEDDAGPEPTSSLLDVVRRRVQTCRSAATPTSSAMAMVTQYCQKPPKWNLNALTYWRSARATEKELAQLALRYAVVPATSVPSERVFSTAGQIVSARRSRLKPEKACMLIFLKQNRWLY